MLPLGLICSAAAASKSLPNVIFVLADDMGVGDVSYNQDQQHHPGAGNTTWNWNPPRTPNLDSIANAKGTMKFNKFYAGAPVCSPTRSSVITGRTPRRECIDSAEGCGQAPAWSCLDSLPLPLTTYSVAEGAKEKGYETFFAGKWHLGDFWVKGKVDRNYAVEKWPSSNPGHHGFDEWHATEASAESSTPNCGCVEEWKTQGNGCIVGGGYWTKEKALECTNYWRWNSSSPDAKCFDPATNDRSCVANLTEKIEGDDSEFIMDTFEPWVTKQVNNNKHFFAFLWLHTNHEPHYALPEWYHKYNDTHGDPAGDYLGTISQMDSQIGRLRSLLQKLKVEDNTMVWFTVDNGAHTAKRPDGQLAAEAGLRQCKASIFEGGIHVAGWVRWPDKIKHATSANYLAGTFDFLPTMMDLWGLQVPNKTWVYDGLSVLPVLTGKTAPDAQRVKAMPFYLSGQTAIIQDEGKDGIWKIVTHPEKGQCATMLPPFKSGAKGPFLFRLDQDPIEQNDLCAADKTRCDAMSADLDALHDSVENSRVYESGCAKKKKAARELFTREHPLITTATGTQFHTDDGCLGSLHVRPFEVLEVSSCESETSQWNPKSLTNLNLPDSLCMVLEHEDCREDNVILFDHCATTTRTIADLYFDEVSGNLKSAACPNQCITYPMAERIAFIATTPVALRECTQDSLKFKPN